MERYTREEILEVQAKAKLPLTHTLIEEILAQMDEIEALREQVRMLTPQDGEFARLAALEQAASPGPWHVHLRVCLATNDAVLADFAEWSRLRSVPGEANVTFVAELRNAAPKLLAMAARTVEAEELLQSCVDAAYGESAHGHRLLSVMAALHEARAFLARRPT